MDSVITKMEVTNNLKNLLPVYPPFSFNQYPLHHLTVYFFFFTAANYQHKECNELPQTVTTFYQVGDFHSACCISAIKKGTYNSFSVPYYYHYIIISSSSKAVRLSYLSFN